MSFATLNATVALPKAINTLAERKSTATRAVRTPKSVIKCEAAKDAAIVTRRGVIGLAAAAAPALFAAKSFALIDYDEDDELLSKIRSDRKAKVQAELLSERRFVKEEGFKDKKFDKEVAYVQKTINRLSKAGQLIEANDQAGLPAVVLGDAWVADLKEASSSVSLTPETKDSAKTLMSDITSFQGAVKGKKSAGEIKSTYLVAVGALESWATATGIDSAVTGL